MDSQKDSMTGCLCWENPPIPISPEQQGIGRRGVQSSLSLEHRAQVADSLGLLLHLCHVGRWLWRRSHLQIFTLRESFLFRMIQHAARVEGGSGGGPVLSRSKAALAEKYGLDHTHLLISDAVGQGVLEV